MPRLPSLACALLLAAGACGPPAPAAPSAGPAGSAAVPAASGAGPDAAVRAALGRVPAAGPLEGALRQASRDELSAALAWLSPAGRAERRRGPLDQGANALVRAALDASDEDALAGLCCGGRSVRALAALRGRGLRDDLPAAARGLSRWAARALAARLGASDRGPLGERDLERAAAVAQALDDAELRAASQSRLAAVAPSAGRSAAAAAACAQALDLEGARRWLGAARGSDTSALGPSVVPTVERLVGLAEELARRGGERAPGDEALPAAVLATRLGRHAMALGLLERSGVAPEGDLRAAVVAAAARGDEGLCQGLERAGEPVAVCPLAWRTGAGYRELAALLDRAVASGRGRDAWSVESAIGLGQVIPLLYEMLGGTFRSSDEFQERIEARLDAIERQLGPGGLGDDDRAALSLFVEAMRQVVRASVRPAGGAWLIDEAAGRSLVDRAGALLGRGPATGLGAQVALAVASVAPRTPAASALVARVAPGGVGEPVRSMLAAVLGQTQGPASLVEQALPSLLRPPPWASPAERERAELLGRELAVVRGPSAAALEALAALAAAPSPEADPVERLQRRLDQSGALARLGRSEEAEAALVAAVEGVPPAQATGPARELLALAETQVAQLLAGGPDAAAQRRGVARLRDRFADGAEIGAIARLHQALVLERLLDRGRTPCEPREVGCAAATRATRDRVRQQIAALEPSVPADARALLRQGVVMAGGNATLHLTFGPGAGLGVQPSFAPRLIVALPLDHGLTAAPARPAR